MWFTFSHKMSYLSLNLFYFIYMNKNRQNILKIILLLIMSHILLSSKIKQKCLIIFCYYTLFIYVLNYNMSDRILHFIYLKCAYYFSFTKYLFDN